MGSVARFLFLGAALGLLVGPIWGQSTDTGPRFFLDLPNAEAESTESEEDIPEIIQFYGQEYEGDGVFFCIDRSSTMAQTTAGGQRKIDVCKQEFSKAFQDMTENMDFGIVFFDLNIMTFRETPVEATADNKAAANQWVQSMQPGYGTCIGGGGQKCLEVANRSSKPKKVMILLGDGDPSWCQTVGNNHSREQARQMIRQANTQNIPVNTIFIGTASQTAGRDFMRLVAQENGGTFSEAQ